jgi:hypothetical protein
VLAGLLDRPSSALGASADRRLYFWLTRDHDRGVIRTFWRRDARSARIRLAGGAWWRRVGRGGVDKTYAAWE